MTKRRTIKKPESRFNLMLDFLGDGGDGVGLHSGKKVYISKSLPEEVVSVAAEEKSGAFYGRILHLETASPDRVPAPCPHYDLCGGCTLQHVNTEYYEKWKADKVRKTLEREGIKPDHWEDTAFLPPSSRRRTAMGVLNLGDRLIMGYNITRSNQIVDVIHCMILDPLLDQIIQKMRPYLQVLAPLKKQVDLVVQSVNGAIDVLLAGRWREGDSFTLEQNEALASLINDLTIARISLRGSEHGEIETLLSRSPVVARFGDLKVSLPPASFLQPSDVGERALTDFVLRHTNGALHIADLFCGCGTFTGPLLSRGAQVYAADSEQASIRALTHSNLSTERRNLFKNPLSASELSRFEAVVIDPPRAGAREQFSALADSDVRSIVSVSCNPSTFARDAKILTDEGYKLESVKIVDQFVWSSHVELAGKFVRD